jgi:dipeptidyl aminopeptidase/acylaminoacyl peptidase
MTPHGDGRTKSASRIATIRLMPGSMLRGRMTPSLRRLVLSQVALGNPAVSPDGRHALYTRRSAQLRGYRRHVWVAPLEGGRPRPLTAGDVRDSAPAARGDRVFFLRDDQVWEVPLAGGEAEQVTALSHGAWGFAPSPDGTRLALLASAPEARFAVGPLATDEAPLARVITRADWRLDGQGYRDRHAHLFVQPARAGARPRRLTRGDWSVDDFAWSPDGTRIAFCADLGDDADLTHAPAVYTVPVRGGEPQLLASLAGSCSAVAWSPEGEHVAFLGCDEAGEPFGCEDSLWVVPAGGGAPRDLAPGRHLHLALTNGSDLPDWEVDGGSGLAWEEGAVISPLTAAGETVLWRFLLDGAPSQVPGCDPHIHGAAVAAGRIVTLRSVASGAVELHLERPAGGPVRLTRDGAAWQRALTGVAHEQVSIPGPAGPIRALLAAPRGAGRSRLPLVLSVIGGPGSSWGAEPWLPDWALTAAGTRMLMPDPRGSASYGRAWLEAIYGAWGGADAEDELACVDWAVGEGLADRARLGVTGLSYGGFMTSWLVARSDRFRAAVSVNGVSNQIAAVGNCDQGALWAPRLGWGLPPADHERLWEQSPLAHADSITTPLLLLQGEADLRCPPADNEQLFVALRALGRPVEYVLYPGESHLMQSTGRPDRRIDMLERTQAWFRAHGVLDPA